MHISIDHLGPVIHAEFELKPLTVFIGDNNQGKTMSLTVATAMLGKGGVGIYAKSCNEDKLLFDEITRISQDIKKDKRSQIDLIDFIQKKYYVNLGKAALSNICTILGGEVSTGGKLSFTASSKEIEDIRSRIIRFQSSIRSRIDLQGIKVGGSSKLDFVAPPEFDLPASDKDSIDNLLKESILDIIRETLKVYFPRTLFFPSERASLPLIFRLLTESSPSSNDELPPSLPLRRYMHALNHLLIWGELFDRRDDRIRAELSDIFQNITQDKISLSDSGFIHKICVTTKDGTEIDLHASSSSIKSLAVFALYLQHRASPGDVIVIDEPEQNLHPTQQAKFIEFLSLLVNTGFKVALTTHSPYIIQHLQSLILAYDLTDKEKEEVISRLYLKRADSLINKEKIGVYLFQNGTSEDILSTNGEINWQTFCDTANIVNGISDLVYSKSVGRNDINAI